MENLSSLQKYPEGRTIFVSYDGDETLMARFFDSYGDWVGCCFESANSSDEDLHYEAKEASDEEVDSEDDWSLCILG